MFDLKPKLTWRRLALLVAFILGSTLPGSRLMRQTQAAATFPAGFVNETVIGNGLILPTAIAFAPGNRLFIAEKRGVVRVWQNGALLPAPFIDLQDEVNDYHDRGLLGLALHPNFPATPYVYLLYVYDPPGAAKDEVGARVSRLVRVTAEASNPTVAATAEGSRVVLLGTNSTLANLGNATSEEDFEKVACGRGPNYVRDCVPADHHTHAIGTVMFGPDGKLYVGNGDAAGYKSTDPRALRALDLDSMAGKIFRLDPQTGWGLSDNPFYDGAPDSNRSKVFSLGLRNPFRFTLHPTTGELYVGDVGWDTWEEINVGRGKNFGWPCYEGDEAGSAQQGQYANNSATAARCRALYEQGAREVQAPVYAYRHGASSASVAAGAFYTGTTWPEAYRDALFISDYNRNSIRFLTFDALGRATANDFGNEVGSGTGSGPVQVLFGPDKSLYYVVLGAKNEVRRVRYVGNGNSPPVADLGASPTSGAAPLKVSFSSQASYDPDAQTLRYAWDFGDGATSDQADPQHIYNTKGKFMARLIVTDPQGETAEAQLEIVVGNNRPDFWFTSPTLVWTYDIGDVIGFSATAIDPEEGDISHQVQWNAMLHHNDHVHFDLLTQRGATGEFVSQDHGDNTYYELCAVVADSEGASSLGKCINVRPHTVRYTFQSVPSGLPINYAGSTYTTPFTVTTITNSRREVSVPAAVGGYTFDKWSDGGARAHTLRIRDGATTVTAYFNAAPNAPVYLSDLTPASQTNGWGPVERDRSNGELGAQDGRPLTLNGVIYPKGLGVHAASELSYALDGKYTSFQADIGVDDEVGGNGSVVFQVFADGEKLYDSGVLYGDTPAKQITVNVAGKRELRLVVANGGDNNGYDHADWANARLIGVGSAAEGEKVSIFHWPFPLFHLPQRVNKASRQSPAGSL